MGRMRRRKILRAGASHFRTQDACCRVVKSISNSLFAIPACLSGKVAPRILRVHKCVLSPFDLRSLLQSRPCTVINISSFSQRDGESEEILSFRNPYTKSLGLLKI